MSSSSSTTLSSCCISGHLHEGTPRGSEVVKFGLNTYVTGEETNKNKTILFITDIFGYKLNNARLLADELAAQGFYVVVPDFFDGDYVPIDLLTKIAPRESDKTEVSLVQKAADGVTVGASLGPWLIKHREAVAKPLVEKFVKDLRTDLGAGAKIGATGYCWGGRYALLLADGQVDAAVANHPAFLAVPKDFEGVTKPISIAVGTKDSMYSNDDQSATEKYFNEELKKKGVQTEFVAYPDEVHGFSVRGDINVPSEKAAKDKSTEQAVNWFKKHLA